MTKKTEYILKEALNMSPEERSIVAHCLITSLDEQESINVDNEWISLAERRLSEIESGKVEPVSWEDIKNKIK